MIEKGKEIVRAPYLKAGDRVALISPAYWVPEEVIFALEGATVRCIC